MPPSPELPGTSHTALPFVSILVLAALLTAMANNSCWAPATHSCVVAGCSQWTTHYRGLWSRNSRHSVRAEAWMEIYSPSRRCTCFALLEICLISSFTDYILISPSAFRGLCRGECSPRDGPGHWFRKGGDWRPFPGACLWRQFCTIRTAFYWRGLECLG